MEQILLLAGSKHTRNIEKSMEMIGFRKLLRTPQFFKEATALTIPGEPELLAIPDRLNYFIEQSLYCMADECEAKP